MGTAVDYYYNGDRSFFDDSFKRSSDKKTWHSIQIDVPRRGKW